MTFKVNLEEKFTSEFYLEDKTSEQAKEKARNRYNNGEVTDFGDFIDVNIDVEVVDLTEDDFKKLCFGYKPNRNPNPLCDNISCQLRFICCRSEHMEEHS